MVHLNYFTIGNERLIFVVVRAKNHQEDLVSQELHTFTHMITYQINNGY